MQLVPANLLNSLPGNFVITTREFKVVFVSAACRELIGAGEPAPGNSFLPELFSGFSGGYSAQLLQLAHQTVRTKAEGSLFLYGAKTGAPYSMKLTCAPVLEGSEITYLVHSFTDLTEQQAAKQKCLQAEQLLQAFPGIAWMSDEAGNITSLSRDYTGISEMSREQVQDGEWMKWVHPEDRKAVQDMWQKFKRQQATGEAIFRLKPNRATSYRWYLSRSVLIRDAAGNVTGYIGLCTDIDTQKQNELELKAEGDRLHMMLDALPYMAWAADPNGSYTYYNKKWWSYFEDSDESWTVDKWANLMHPDEHEKVVTAWDQSLATGTAYSITLRWKAHVAAEYRWFNASAAPVKDAEGNLAYWMGSTVDIHEQEMAKEKLRAMNQQLEKSLQQFRYLAEMVPQFIWTATPNGEADFLNNSWYTYTGVDQHVKYQEVVFQVIHPEDREQAYKNWKSALKAQTSFITKFRMRKHDGTYSWFLSRAEAMRDELGNVQKWFGATTDIDEQVRFQNSLEKENAAFQFLSDLVPHLVWRTDAKGFHNYFNQRWVEFTEYTVESSLGTEMWNNLLHPEDRERARRVWEHSLATGAPYEIEYRLKRATDGMWRWFLARALPVYGVGGEILQWYGTCTDIEDKKKAELLLQRQKGELELINSDQDRFVHMIGHDLKLPLVNMEALFEELVEGKSLYTPDAERLIRHFRKSHSTMTGTLQDLLELAKLPRNSTMATTEISFREVLEEVLGSLSSLLTASQAEVELSLDAEHDQIQCTKASMRSVLHNLISNAVKYRHPERRPKIELTTSWQGDYLCLQVKDNGLGMDLEKDHQRMFKPFSRLHSHTEGSGLGLYIVKRIVEAGGGDIRVSSETGNGSSFSLRLNCLAGSVEAVEGYS